MKDAYILSINLGTSSLKAAVYTSDLKCIALQKQAYGEKDHIVAAEDWWTAFIGVLELINETIPLERIDCLSFSGYNAIVGVDKNVVPVSEVIPYYDNAPREYAEKFYSLDDEDYIFSKTGNRLFANGIMALSISWLRRNKEVYDRTHCFLYSSGFIAARLTGRFVTDTTRASLSLLHNPAGKDLDWDDELCSFFNIDRRKLPVILQSWEAAGIVTPLASALTGLSQGIPVVIGGMDSMCGAIGSGIVNSNQILDIGSLAGGLSIVSERPVANKKFYLVRYMLPGLWANIAPLNDSFSLVAWFLKNITPQWTYQEMIQHVATASPFCKGLQFLPCINGARYPYWNPYTKGHFVNLCIDNNRDDLARAVLEGIGYIYRQALDDIIEMGFSPKELVPSGADEGSRVWLQIKADIMKLPYAILQDAECSTLGAAIIGAYSIGLMSDMRAFIKKNVHTKSQIIPNPSLGQGYDSMYQSFTAYCKKYYLDDASHGQSLLYTQYG